MSKRHGLKSKVGAIALVFSTILTRSVWGMLGRVFGALALFALFRYASNFGLSLTFKLILDIYLIALKTTIGLLDPAVVAMIHFINDLFRIDLRFAEGWRHIFVVLQILFVRDAGTAFSDGRCLLGFVRLLVGFSVAFLFAVLAFLSEFANPIVSNILFGIVPIVGIFAYDIIMYFFSSTLFYEAIGVGEVKDRGTRIQFFWGGVSRSFFRFFLVSAATLNVFLIPWVSSLDFPHGGLIAITAGLVANASYWIVRGSVYAAAQVAKGKRYGEAFIESESGRFGLAVVGILFWFGFFCVLNAGMRLLGF